MWRSAGRARATGIQRRMGYFLVMVLGFFIVALCVAALVRRSRRLGTGTLRGDFPVARAEPSADEPTPAASVVSEDKAREAQRHVPPA